MNKQIKLSQKSIEFQKMVSGNIYNPSDELLTKIHFMGLENCQKLNKINITSKRLSKYINKCIPSSVNKNFFMFTPFYFEYGININVGYDCFLNYHNTFLDCSKITLGNNVFIGSGCTLATPLHPKYYEDRINQDYPTGHHDLEYSAPITINDNTWLGSNVTVCGGVTIGKNCVIGAGSVVTKDIPDNSLAYGIPARVIRLITEDDKIDILNKYNMGEKIS